MRFLAFLAALGLAEAYGLRADVSPVQKVIQLMQDMLAKGKAMKQDEEVKFAAYKQFCEGTAAEKQSSIEDAAAEIEDLQAAIQKAESDAAVLAEDITGLDSDIAGWEEDMKEAKAMREKEAADYAATHAEYEESLDAIDRALIVLKKQSADVPQGFMQEDEVALLQELTKKTKVPASAKRTLLSFLALRSRQDPLSVSAPQAKGYEFQSGGVVEMLENLMDKFMDEKRELEKDEMGAEHAHKLMMMELKDSISAAESMRGEKAKIKATREETAAAAKGDLAGTTSAKAEDTAYLEDLNAQCEQKSNDFQSRQQLRAEELEAIQKAIEIISSPDVAGNSEKHLSLSQSSFALRASARTSARVDPTRQEVVAYLQHNANSLNSRNLNLLAEQISTLAMADPFAKVKKMIDTMITKLLEEANEEADHKGWCDKEMGVNAQTRDGKTEEVNTLTAEVDKLKADIMKVAQQIADLSTAIAEIDAAVAEATEIREAEKAKNKETIEDAEAAQTAVGQALAVLKYFYKTSATATAFVQQTPEEEAPETFDEPYTGMGGASGGVVGMLEVIESDFNKLEAETTAAEEEAAKEYDRLIAESKKDTAVKTADMDYKKKSKTEAESDLSDSESDLKGAQKELDAALVYYEKLKPSCITPTVSYEERVAKREAEIESLRTALKILSDA
jgi:uncharacterized protein YoxC